MTRKSKAPQKLEQVAREFAARVVQTAKHRDLEAEARREQREAAVSKALAEHLARRRDSTWNRKK